jgi:DNA-binding CsgD family transcriptional regulator
VKARKVKGLHPDGALADNLQRIVAARLDELASFVPKALDPAEVKALHDMRIAAKRLRYILEVAAEPCFGAYAQTAIKRTKDLQDLLGELHDCDVQLPRVRALHDELRAADALEARARAGDAPDLRRRVQAHRPDVVVADPSLAEDRLDNLVAIDEDTDVAATLRQIDSGGRRLPHEPFSRREREVLALMAEGLSNAAIAERLWLSERSVEANTKRIYDRLGLLGDRTTNRRVLAVLTHLRARPPRAARPAA